MSNMAINTNVLALNSHRALKNVGAAQAQASGRLSTGSRINSAADDAAGLAISEKMRSQIRGLDMASKNSQDSISLVQTAEGGMTEVGNMVQRVRELVVQAANDTNEVNDRQKIQNEIDQLLDEVDAMSGRVEFNEKKLLNGSYASSGLTFQVGANASQTISLKINGLDTKTLGLTTTTTTGSGSAAVTTTNRAINVATADGSKISSMITVANTAVTKVADERAKLGAVQNRLEYTIKSLDISSENLAASESRIRDADMAKEMMKLTKTNVLQQAATSMLSQANQAPQNVLQLLR